MKKLLPQANTLATVVVTFKFIANSYQCTLEDIAEFNQFRLRQASYYANACYYLGLIDDQLHITPLGEDIMLEPRKAKVRIYELIIKHELIGQIFAKISLYPKRKAFQESKEIVWSLYPDYGEAVINRRTSCLIGWCEEVLEYIKTQA